MVSRPMTWDELVEVITHQNQEIAKLRKVVDAAKELVTQINNRTKTMGLDMSNYHAISITVKPGDAGRDYWEAVWAFEQALAELDKEGNKRIKCNI